MLRPLLAAPTYNEARRRAIYQRSESCMTGALRREPRRSRIRNCLRECSVRPWGRARARGVRDDNRRAACCKTKFAENRCCDGGVCEHDRPLRRDANDHVHVRRYLGRSNPPTRCHVSGPRAGGGKRHGLGVKPRNFPPTSRSRRRRRRRHVVHAEPRRRAHDPTWGIHDIEIEYSV